MRTKPLCKLQICKRCVFEHRRAPFLRIRHKRNTAMAYHHRVSLESQARCFRFNQKLLSSQLFNDTMGEQSLKKICAFGLYSAIELTPPREEPPIGIAEGVRMERDFFIGNALHTRYATRACPCEPVTQGSETISASKRPPSKKSQSSLPTLSREKQASARRLARFPSSRSHTGFVSSLSRASASASASSRGTTIPPDVSPPSKISDRPCASAATTGNPQAIASRGETGKPSWRDGNT